MPDSDTRDNLDKGIQDGEKEKILSAALKNMVIIAGKVYGLEDDSEPEVFIDCLSRISSCKAVCCSYAFALTQEEVKKGLYKYNPSRPYYMAKDADGFCPYLDRITFLCGIHDKRPFRCKKYSCEHEAGRLPQKNRKTS
jgi:Fe-S-cluster containining protein